MERKVTIATLSEAVDAHVNKTQTKTWLGIALNGRHMNHQLIIQYSNRYPLKVLYHVGIRRNIDEVWVATQKMGNDIVHPRSRNIDEVWVAFEKDE
jgi:hypothetical protein